MPQANSTTSTPRWMSPLASGTVLPCSEASSSASASISPRMSSRKRIITRARFCGLVAAQAGWAAAAFSTAARSSALLASATWAWTSPVEGWNTSANRPLVAADGPAADEVPDRAHARLPAVVLAFAILAHPNRIA